MSFDVEPSAVRTFSRHLGDAAGDAAEGKRYLIRHGDFSFREQGIIMSILMSSHSTLVEELQTRLTHLQDVLEQSELELRHTAKHYEDTDRGSAAQLDSSYPTVERPTLR